MAVKIFRSLLLVVALGASGAVLAAEADPSMSQIYSAVEAGHVDQAQQMIQEVLRDHPNSAKAHYVAAEVDAKGGDLAGARQELSNAERLAPGLPFAKPQSVSELRAELAGGRPAYSTTAPQRVGQSGSSLPFGLIFLVLAGFFVVWLVMRNRRQAMAYSQYPAGSPYPGAQGPVGGYPGSPGYGPQLGGMGSGIVGGLASGLAVGAGVVAGEEIAHHFLDGRRDDDSYRGSNDAGVQSDPNADAGGNDFGVADSGSWDDSSSMGGDIGGGGDDWS